MAVAFDNLASVCGPPDGLELLGISSDADAFGAVCGDGGASLRRAVAAEKEQDGDFRKDETAVVGVTRRKKVNEVTAGAEDVVAEICHGW